MHIKKYFNNDFVISCPCIMLSVKVHSHDYSDKFRLSKLHSFVPSDKGFDLFNHRVVLFCDYVCIDQKSNYVIIWLASQKLKYYTMI